MGIVSQILESENLLERRDVKLDASWTVLANANLSNLSNAGVAVTEDLALRISAVFACVRVLAESVAFLPLITYQRLNGGGKERVQDHYLYPVLHDIANPEMTAMTFRETMQGHVALRGNAYAWIEREGGKVKALWPLKPDAMEVGRDEGGLVYTYRPENGGTKRWRSGEVFHLRGLSSNGLTGHSILRVAREAMGLGRAAEEYGAKFFAKNAQPAGYLKHPSKLKDKKAQKRMVASWNEAFSGLENVHKTALLEEGVEWVKIGIPPEDAQFLQTRKFQVSEIARIFRVPPHLIADLDRATFSNIEHQSLEFVIFSLAPWLIRWEQQVNKDLIFPGDRKRIFVEHLIDGLLRGDIKNRYEAYKVGRLNGWLTTNEIRQFENMNPIEGGDDLWMPLNELPVGQAERNTPVNVKAVVRELPEWRGLSERNRIVGAYRGLFREAGQRLVNRETLAVKRAVGKLMKNRTVEEFEEWLEQFYEEFPAYVERDFRGLIATYGGEIYKSIKTEINVGNELDENMERFLHEYVGGLSARHIKSSRGQIEKIVKESPPEELVEKLETRLDEWAEKRPGKIAKRETVQVANAVARAGYGLGGVQTLVWVAQGGEACGYCQELDGRVVGINDEFVRQDEDFEPEGADGSMHIRGPKFHPPLHDGCECGIEAGG